MTRAGQAPLEALLCEGGMIRATCGEFPCTGSAHLPGGTEVICTYEGHKVPQPDLTGVTLAPNLTIGPAVPGDADLTGQKWTCS